MGIPESLSGAIQNYSTIRIYYSFRFPHPTGRVLTEKRPVFMNKPPISASIVVMSEILAAFSHVLKQASLRTGCLSAQQRTQNQSGALHNPAYLRQESIRALTYTM